MIWTLRPGAGNADTPWRGQPMTSSIALTGSPLSKRIAGDLFAAFMTAYVTYGLSVGKLWWPLAAGVSTSSRMTACCSRWAG
jgi:hypothetical protein